MEHQTLTTFAAGAVGGDWVDWLNVHELAHQWWGDWVTLDDWRELWLNEGFATYSEVLWAEHLGAEDLAEIVEEMDWWGYFYGPVYDNPTPFSGTVYEKAAWVLRMLRFVLGDDAFFAGVADYREAHAGATATTAELRSTLEQVAGTDLGWFFDQWVFGLNRPRYVWGWSAGDGPSVVLTVAQRQTNAGLFRMPVDVDVSTTGGTERHRVWLEAMAEQTVEIEVGATPTGVELDPDHQLLCEMAADDEPDLELGPDFPGPFDAGPVQVGSSAELTVPLMNVGGEDLTVYSAELWVGDAYSLAPGQHFPLRLTPGASSELRVRFEPQAPYDTGDYLVLVTNDPSRGGVVYLRLDGTGTLSASPQLSAPSRVELGAAPVGGVVQTGFWVANAGAEDLVLAVSVSGDGFSLAVTPPTSIPSGEWVYLAVRFSPVQAGAASGTLWLDTNDPSRARHAVQLTGEGAPAPRLTVAPPLVAFGAVAGRAESSLTLGNVGDEDLRLAAFELAPPWSLVAPSQLPASLAPGASVQLVIGVEPTGQGEIRGSLRILSNDPAAPLATVPLGALGLGSAPLAGR